MKKAICLILVALLALSTLGLPALAGDQGELGRLTKLNVDEDTLTQAIMESYFDKVPFSRYRFFDNLNSMIGALVSGSITGMALDEFTAEYLLSRAEEYAIYNPPETTFHGYHSLWRFRGFLCNCACVSAARQDF